MYVKSAQINEKHLWEDWGLYIEKCDIGSPEVNDIFVSVPWGKNIDLSEVNGPVTYKKRNIQIELGGIMEKKEWRTFLSGFMNEYHGKEIKIIFDDDSAFYYKGRFYVKTDIERTARIGKFDAEIIAEPYKYEIHDSQEPWKWDPFNFVSGVIRYIGEIEITEAGKQIVIPCGNMLTVPVFQVFKSQNLKVRCGERVYMLKDGRNRYPQIKVGSREEVSFDFEGTGVVKIYYRGGSL